MSRPLAFIGTGIMGRPMTLNLLKAGYPVAVYNRSRPSLDELGKAGATVCASAAEAAGKGKVIMTCLPDSPDVEAVALGPGGIKEGAKPGSLYVDMSTISPAVSKKVAAALAEGGVRMLDAPVSGGDVGAREGTLSIMMGGAAADFEEARPVMEAMGKTIVHVGDQVGAGGYVKIANQIMVGLHIGAMSEALVLGSKAGVDPEKMIAALSGGMAGSRVMEMRSQNLVKGEYPPGFRIRLHRKDLRLAMEAGAEFGVGLPLAGLLYQNFHSLVTAGRGELDHSGYATLVEDLAGHKISGGS
ncbi:MAG: NAD(P)-binding domain-containing protein [bacterium]